MTLLRNKLSLIFAKESISLPTTALKNGKGCYGSNGLPLHGCSPVSKLHRAKTQAPELTYHQLYWFSARVLPGMVLAQVSKPTVRNRSVGWARASLDRQDGHGHPSSGTECILAIWKGARHDIHPKSQNTELLINRYIGMFTSNFFLCYYDTQMFLKLVNKGPVATLFLSVEA